MKPEYLFKKHYTREEAQALLPRIRGWLIKLRELREDLATCEGEMAPRLQAGEDLGGEPVHRWLCLLLATYPLLDQFQSRQIFIKDLERGLLDFPAIHNGREVFLCWEQGEHSVEFWHDITAGYAGRQRL